MQVAAGSTFLFDLSSPPAHLWVVASIPDSEGRFLVVSLTSLKGSKDQTVILNPGDHPFIKWPTCAFYQLADIMTVAKLEEVIRLGHAKLREPLSPKLAALVLDGFAASQFTKKRVVEFARLYRARTR